MVKHVQRQYGLNQREREVHDEKATAPVQVGFAW
jgi:hypothetical protein